MAIKGIKIEQPAKRIKTISLKVSAEQDAKLSELAEKLGVKKSTLVYEMVKEGYKATARRKTF